MERIFPLQLYPRESGLVGGVVGRGWVGEWVGVLISGDSEGLTLTLPIVSNVENDIIN